MFLLLLLTIYSVYGIDLDLTNFYTEFKTDGNAPNEKCDQSVLDSRAKFSKGNHQSLDFYLW